MLLQVLDAGGLSSAEERQRVAPAPWEATAAETHLGDQLMVLQTSMCQLESLGQALLASRQLTHLHQQNSRHQQRSGPVHGMQSIAT